MMQAERRVTREGIKIHENEDFYGMRKSCNLAAKALDMIVDHVYPGVTTDEINSCLLYTSPSPRDRQKSRMPSSA